VWRVTQEAEGNDFHNRAQNEGRQQHDHQGEKEVRRKIGKKAEADIGANHENLAVRKRHHAQGAEDNGETQG